MNGDILALHAGYGAEWQRVMEQCDQIDRNLQSQLEGCQGKLNAARQSAEDYAPRFDRPAKNKSEADLMKKWQTSDPDFAQVMEEINRDRGY